MYGLEGCYGDEVEHGLRYHLQPPCTGDSICYQALDPIKLETLGRGPVKLGTFQEDPMLCQGTYFGPRPNCPKIIGMVEPREDHCFDWTAVTGTKIKINNKVSITCFSVLTEIDKTVQGGMRPVTASLGNHPFNCPYKLAKLEFVLHALIEGETRG